MSKITPYNMTDIVEREIRPLLDKLEARLDEHNIPSIIAISPVDTGDGYAVDATILAWPDRPLPSALSAAAQCLKDDKLATALLEAMPAVRAFRSFQESDVLSETAPAETH